MNVKAVMFCSALLLIGCQPRVDSRGNIMLADELKNLVVGKTTMSDVIQRCGTPSLHVDNFTWIYISATAKETSFSEVSLKNRLVVKMTFSEDRVLRSVKKIKQPRKDIVPMDKKITHLRSTNNR